MNYFVTAIGTDSGKTVAASILCEALGTDYWKPIQAGFPRDTDTVKQLVSNPIINFHPEGFLLKMAASPHAAAKAEGIQIKLENFTAPKTSRDLIIEGAGGCLVPINDQHFVVDLISSFNAEVILVANLYLGSINHTLLTLEALKKRAARIKGIIFNGEENPESERIILKHASLPCLLRISPEPSITREIIKKYASILKENWYA